MKKKSHDMTLGWVFCVVADLAGCGSDGPKASSQGGDSTNPGAGGSPDASPGGDGGTAGPLYALGFTVCGPDQGSDTTYVAPLASLDIPSVTTSSARPFVGDADMATYGGNVFVSSGEAPEIDKFSIDASGNWSAEGAVSFANYGVQQASIMAWTNTFISPSKAYFIDPNSGIQVIWNPQTMSITGTISPPSSPAFVRDGYFLEGSAAIVRGNRLYRTVYWENASDSTFTSEQYLTVYDTDGDKLVSITPESRCPTLGGLATADEAGTLYFSDWWDSVQATLLGKNPANCALRIPPGSDTFDPDWVLSYKSITGGHEAGELQYTANGHGVLAVFHDENVTITASTTAADLYSSENWSWWSVDFNAMTATPIGGAPLMLGGDVSNTIDARTLLLVPHDSWATTQEYALGAGPRATLQFTIPGWSKGELAKVR